MAAANSRTRSDQRFEQDFFAASRSAIFEEESILPSLDQDMNDHSMQNEFPQQWITTTFTQGKIRIPGPNDRMFKITSLDQVDWNRVSDKSSPENYSYLTLHSIRKLLHLKYVSSEKREDLAKRLLSAKQLTTQEIQARSIKFWKNYQNSTWKEMLDMLDGMGKLTHVPADFNLWEIQYAMKNKEKHKYIPKNPRIFERVLANLSKMELVSQPQMKSML